MAVYASQGICKLSLIAGQKDRFYGLKGVQTHTRRASPRKETENHFFPQVGIGSAVADRFKLGEPPPYLRLAFGMSHNYVFNCYRFSFSFHKDGLILGASGGEVNDLRIRCPAVRHKTVSHEAHE